MTLLTPSRRRFLMRTAATLASTSALPRLAAETIHTADPILPHGRSIRLLVGFAPGGGTDMVARLLQTPLSQRLGVPVIIENRPGAGGQIAAHQLKAAPADGSVLFLSHDHTISILPLVQREAGFDPKQDFTPVGGFASFVNTFAVTAQHPAHNFQEYIAWAHQQNDARSAVGIPAPASTPEFLVQQLARRYAVNLFAVPYKGSAPMIGDMLSGQIPAGIGSVLEFIHNHREGKLRVLAVLGGQRQPLLPEVPTFAELGIAGLEDMPYYGIFAPRGVPADYVQRFSNALHETVQQPHIRSQLQALGLVIDPMTPTQLAHRERAYTTVWQRIIRDSGFTPQ